VNFLVLWENEFARHQQWEGENRVENQCQHVKREADQKQQEELMVSVANTVVDECAVVVKPFNTFVAVIAVACIFRT